VRVMLHLGMPVGEQFVREIAANVGTDVETLLPFAGLPLRAFRQKAICGNAIMRAADGGGPELEAKLASERASVEAAHRLSLGESLRSPKVLALSLVYFGLLAGLYGVQFWLPQIVKGFGLSNLQTGFASALPFALGALAMVLWGARSDRKQERVRHIVAALLVSAAALAASAYGGNLVLTMAALIIASMAGFAAFGLFWTLPAAMLTGSAAVGGLALINSIGSLSGFGGPYLIGWIKDLTGSPVAGLLFLAVLPFVAALLTLTLKFDRSAEFTSAKS
jgi:MFS transporter, ACS family, tartrate transporter